MNKIPLKFSFLLMRFLDKNYTFAEMLSWSGKCVDSLISTYRLISEYFRKNVSKIHQDFLCFCHWLLECYFVLKFLSNICWKIPVKSTEGDKQSLFFIFKSCKDGCKKEKQTEYLHLGEILCEIVV